MIIRDEAYWLPLIAVLSGCRQEEICQLHTADIRLEEGLWVFDINDKPPKRLKNGSQFESCLFTIPLSASVFLSRWSNDAKPAAIAYSLP